MRPVDDSAAQQVLAYGPDGGRLAVHEGADHADRPGQRPYGVDQQRVQLVLATGAMDPDDLQGAGRDERHFARSVLDLDHHHDRATGPHRLRRRRDCRKRALVADEEGGVGLGVRSVTTGRPTELQAVTGPGAGGPPAGETRLTVDDEVNGQPSQRSIPAADRVAPRVGPLLPGQLAYGVVRERTPYAAPSGRKNALTYASVSVEATKPSRPAPPSTTRTSWGVSRSVVTTSPYNGAELTLGLSG